MKLIATRHAETNYNVQNLVNYDPSVDVHLTEKGIKQAEDLAEQLKDHHFDAIYISRLPRTRQTAEIINRYHHQDFIVDELLDDVRNGFEGQTCDIAKGWRNSQPDPITARYQDKYESVADMTTRVKRFLDRLKMTHNDNDTILIVTSSHIIKQLRLLTGEITMEQLMREPAKHATYYTFEIQKNTEEQK